MTEDVAEVVLASATFFFCFHCAIPRDATQSAVMPQYVVCLSVRHVQVPCPRLLWRTNRKSHTRFRCVPKAM